MPINTQKCYDAKTIKNFGGIVNENHDGSVSVFMPSQDGSWMIPSVLNKQCCEKINTGYTFDINTQTCMWSKPVPCDIENIFKIELNPRGNDGAIFYISENENCALTIDFDYLFKFKCEAINSTTTLGLHSVSKCKRQIDVFETFDVSMTLDVVTSGNTLETVHEYTDLFPAIGKGNLYEYLKAHPNSGFYVCGDPSCVPLNLNLTGPATANATSCDVVISKLYNGLFLESGLSGTTNGVDTFNSSLSNSAFTSNWLHYKTTISDPDILKSIANKKIKISLKLKHTCSDVCILLDNIVLDKTCTNVERNDIFVTQCPGFELDRIRDNKKAWISNTSNADRIFSLSNNNGNNTIRQTNYDVDDERLVINTKEIDLDISLASAIETDVWCYLVDNPCLLTGFSNCDPCGYKQFQDESYFEFMDNDPYDFMDEGYITGDTKPTCCGDNKIMFDKLLTQPLSAITVVEDFEYYMTSELIDTKNRQTISSYPTLRALYDRYINSYHYCGNNSSAFDYITMDQFAGLVGSYWVDIVEQVIPSTTIWGSIKIYSNTIFDQQKYKYRAYSSLFCNNPFYGEVISSPISGTSGTCVNVETLLETLTISGGTAIHGRANKSVCETICIAQMNHGSEFIGSVNVIEATGHGKSTNNLVSTQVINEPPIVLNS